MGAGPAWMRRGTQGHVAAPRGPTQAPRGAIYHILHYVYIYIKCSLSSPYKGGSYPYKRSGIIYPTVSINKPRVGLSFITYLPFRRRGARRDVGSRGRSIDERRSHGAGTTDRDQEHVGFKIIITVRLPATWLTEERRSDARGPPDQIRSTCVKSKRYNGHDLILEEGSGASDEDPTNAITRVL